MQQMSASGIFKLRHFSFSQSGMLMLAIASMSMLFILYKIIYPFPDFYYDSFHYVALALDSQFITVWPIGYSLFLRAIHIITASAYVLVALQYMLLQGGAFFLAFTIFKVLQPDRRARMWVIALLSVNPLAFYLANLISSDVLFTALSLFWIALVLRIVINPSIRLFLFQGILLAFIFLVRYQAAYYPLVMIVALWMAHGSRSWRILSALIGLSLMCWIVLATKQQNLKRFGSDQFSPQSSWMLASNALYMYPHINVDTTNLTSGRLVNINAYVHRFMTSRGLMQDNWTPADGAQFMFGNGPMWNYMTKEIRQNPGQPTYWYYNRLGKDWVQYGKTLVKQHPMAYLRYFLLPNVAIYFCPPPEQFSQYATGDMRIPGYVADWFRIPGSNIGSRWPQGAGYMSDIFRPFFLFLNLQWLLVLAGLLWRRGWSKLDTVKLPLILLLLLMLAGNASLLILAGPVVLRYVSFAAILGIIMLPLWPMLIFSSSKQSNA